MSDDGDLQPDDDSGPSHLSLFVTLLSIAAFAGLYFANDSAPSTTVKVAFLLSQVVLISIVIWQACDPFADAAQWIGKKFHIPGSVRGATLDAIASSLPELFTGVFFVLFAIMFSADSQPHDTNEVANSNEVRTDNSDGSDDAKENSDLSSHIGNGFGNAIATCAGSAVYNMILIPAFCALVISFYRKERPTIDVETEVISRDGMWFLFCSVLLIVFLFGNVMYWWMGVVFLVLYAFYVLQLYSHARDHRRKVKAIQERLNNASNQQKKTVNIVKKLAKDGISVSASLVEQVRSGYDEDEVDDDEGAGIFFGYFEIGLSQFSAWAIILVSTVIAAAACYWLVEVTLATARVLAVPEFFVAVTLAAAASSVPDTFLSIGAAMRGDDSGAVSNAFGSNIFDICICMAIPLLINSALLEWGAVPLTANGKPLAGLVDLRILLAVLTILTLAIMWHRKQLTRFKAIVLCALYGLFIAYAVAGSYGFSFANWVTNTQ